MNDITEQQNGYHLAQEATSPPVHAPAILPAPEHGRIGAQAITGYAKALADHICGVRDEIRGIADEVCAELTITAENVLEIGKLEADRTVSATARMRAAVLDAKALRDRFVNGAPKERPVDDTGDYVPERDDPANSDADIVDPPPGSQP